MRCALALVASVAAVWTAKLDAQEPDYEIYFGNLHSHTSYSDGTGVPEDAYLHARDVAGLDFLAVTEHNHSRAGTGRIAREPELYNGARPDSLIQTALRYTQDGVFVALYGQEFSSISSGNHANILEAGEIINETAVRNGHWDDLLQTWLPAHPDSQGLAPIVLLNHPATSGSRNDVEYGRDDFPNLDSWLTAHAANTRLINLINGPSHRNGDPPGRPSESEFRRYLNEGLRVGPTADQDNHQPNWGSAAETRTAVLATSLTRADILDALRDRRVYATQDRNLELYASIAGHIIGSEISDLSTMQVGAPDPAPRFPARGW
jgi:trimeric autotransporter adhesin